MKEGKILVGFGKKMSKDPWNGHMRLLNDENVFMGMHSPHNGQFKFGPKRSQPVSVNPLLFTSFNPIDSLSYQSTGVIPS